MAAIIKTQIVKHLSRFAKNLSPDKIQLSTLKGEGELNNLELNEDILMELMDLPTWVRLTKAVCNRVNIKIQWSKLKSQPIELYLDEVQVSMEMCEELREPCNASGLPSYSSGGRYGFGDRVVDGMYLQINAVIVSFISKAFQASINLSRIIIQSKTPTWRTPSDLQHTKISEKQNDVMLTFKEVSWQTLKVEADCTVGDGRQQTTPLRLITNQSKIRITVKKRYSDCSAVATKLQFIMDDLLWIVTDSQMKAAIVFAKHLKDSIDKSNEQSKKFAAQQLQKQQSAQKRPVAANHPNSNRASPVSSLFQKYDVPESSYHVQTCRVDLHICDDINDENRNRLVDGGAIGIAIMKLHVAHYPMRIAGHSRLNWSSYDENIMARDDWTSALIKNYIQQLKSDKANGVQHEGLLKASPESVAKRLVERLTMLKVEDFFITTVSRESNDSSRPPKFLMSDKKSLHLPSDMSAIHVEHTEYFFDHNTSLPVPCPNAYIKINPIKLVVDTYTVSWFHSFGLCLAKDVDELLKALPVDNKKQKERMELRLEALMPKVVLPVVGSVPLYQHDRPDSLQILMSRVVVTNNHLALPSSNNSMSAHKSLVNGHSQLFLYNTKQFPNNASTDLTLLSQEQYDYSSSSRLPHTVSASGPGVSSLSTDMLSIELEQFWMEFTGVKNSGSRPVSFLESFPVTVWLTVPPPPDKGSSHTKELGNHQPLQRLTDLPKTKPIANGHSRRHMSVMVNIGAKICAQINHYQFCFLMRLLDSFTDMMDTMAKERSMHMELFSKESGKPEVIPTLDTATEPESAPMTVILELKEVQLALLAKPGATISNTDTVSTLDSAATNAADMSSSPPTTHDAIGPQVDNVTGIAIYVNDPLCATAADVSPLGSDSGIASTTTSLFTEESDMPIRRSAELVTARGQQRSSINTADVPLPAHPAHPEHNVGLKLSAALGKVTSKMKSISKVVDDSDNFDVMSISSGVSDDFDMLAEISGQDEEAAFGLKPSVGLNDDEHGSTISTGLVDRPKQMFSVTIFKLCGIEVGVEVQGSDMVAKVALKALHNEDKGNVYYEDFQAQQLSDMTSFMSENSTEYPIRVRFSQGPAAADLATGAAEKGFAHIKVSNYNLSFLSSTVDKLGALFKDEKVDQSLPLLIEVSDFDFELRDDALPAYNTESPSVPIGLHVSKVSLLRSINGIITVQGDTSLKASNCPLKVKVVNKSDQSTNTEEEVVEAAVSEPAAASDPAVAAKRCVNRLSSSAQLLEEMDCLQSENKALREQIIRLNEKLIEKDHVEFERGEFSHSATQRNFELHKDLEFYKKEVRILRNQIVFSASATGYL